MTDTAAEQIADAYLTAAYSSLIGRTKRDQQDGRSQSYGLLKALVILQGSMEEACRLIEGRHDKHHSSLGNSIDSLLYEFWTIERPRVA